MRHLSALLLIPALALVACPPPPPDLEGLEVAIVPQAPVEGAGLAAMILVDAWGFAEDEFRYAYAWTVDGEALPEWTGRSIDSGQTAAGQRWEVTVTPLLEGWREDPETITGPPAVASVVVRAPSVTDADGDGFEGAAGDGADCDDDDPAVFPGAPEDCDGLDDDCDGMIDDTTDLDGDGVYDCEDCDDTDAANFPGNAEVCDGLDNDCDEEADEEMADADGDGFDVCADCDDGDADVFPGNTETCEPGGATDQVDDDCFAANDLSGMLYWFRDDDDDGFGEDPAILWCGDPPPGLVASGGDCDDTDADVFPGAPEICNGGIDDNCDGQPGGIETDDDGDGQSECEQDCNDNDDTVWFGAGELCDMLDNDCDGMLSLAELDNDFDGVNDCDGDCDDADPAISPDEPEVCNAGVDDDCDPATDETVDGDGDTLSVCEDDCDDGDPAVSPLATEVAGNGIDDDCDGEVDE